MASETHRQSQRPLVARLFEMVHVTFRGCMGKLLDDLRRQARILVPFLNQAITTLGDNFSWHFQRRVRAQRFIRRFSTFVCKHRKLSKQKVPTNHWTEDACMASDIPWKLYCIRSDETTSHSPADKDGSGQKATIAMVYTINIINLRS